MLKYSMGIGDRFGRQGVAQLDAIIKARQHGVSVTPVWNKSHREHTIVGSRPGDVRVEADYATKLREWSDSYFVDADHVGLDTIDAFVESSDWFTLDVANFLGAVPEPAEIAAFVEKHKRLLGTLEIPGIDVSRITEETIAGAARQYLVAVREAGRIYRHLLEVKQAGCFVTEVSMDETDRPQTPLELLFILAAVADQGIPAQIVAPRFQGRFNKGIDYVGDVEQFAEQFEQYLAIIAFAVKEFDLPETLKLSVHSGSDKFSIYGPIAKALEQFDAGVHLKTAGTTWLEELIGLASAGGDGLEIAKEIYREAMGRFDELCGPYASVIDINRHALPDAKSVDVLDGETFAAVLRHDPACPAYNPNVRQLLHVSYKVAAEMGSRFIDALEKHADVVAQNVTENLFERHLRPLFLSR